MARLSGGRSTRKGVVELCHLTSLAPTVYFDGRVGYLDQMNEEMRDAARKRIKAKRDFWNMVVAFVIIAAVMNVVWLMSGYRSYYWPAWPMIGFAIATAFTAFNIFGPGRKPITDDDIDREVRKMGGGGPPHSAR